ncbi:hypothetical protein ACFE04_009693 [Oxalis oulophora]
MRALPLSPKIAAAATCPLLHSNLFPITQGAPQTLLFGRDRTFFDLLDRRRRLDWIETKRLSQSKSNQTNNIVTMRLEEAGAWLEFNVVMAKAEKKSMKLNPGVDADDLDEAKDDSE